MRGCWADGTKIEIVNGKVVLPPAASPDVAVLLYKMMKLIPNVQGETLILRLQRCLDMSGLSDHPALSLP